MKRTILFVGFTAVTGLAAGILSESMQRPGDQPTHLAVVDTSAGSRRAALQGMDGEERAMGVGLAALTGKPDLLDLARFGEELENMRSDQIAKLLERIERNGDSFFDDDRLSWLFLWWQKRDPRAAAAWIQPRLQTAAQDGPKVDRYLKTGAEKLILGWAKADPEAALGFARQHVRSPLSRKLLVAALDAWPTTDPASYLTIALELPPGPTRNEAVQHLLENWAAAEPAGALARARTLPEAKAQAKAVSTVLRKWSEKDASAALAQYQTLGLSDPTLLSDLVSNEAHTHPAEAAEFLSHLDPAQILRTGPELVNAWVQKDPAAALAWALDNEVSIAGRQSISEKVIHDGLDRGTESRISSFSPMQSALEKNSGAVIAWIEALPAGPDRDRMMESAFESGLKLDEALRLFSSLPPAAAARAAGSIARQFEDDPAGGEQWASALPAGAARENAWATLGRKAGANVTPATDADRDAYFSGRANGPDLKEPERLDLAMQISDPVKQRDVVDGIVENAGDQAAKECRAWLETANVSEDLKVRWRAILDAPSSSKGFDY